MSSGGTERVVVVGGGPAGLAAAAVLKSKGIDALVLDRAEEVGASWRGHYDRLRLHTVRWLSSLPGLPIPRSNGKWVARDSVIDYLQDYARHHELRIRLSTNVESIRRADSVWSLDSGTGPVPAHHVIVATGFNREPVVPAWEGADGFTGLMMHSSDYRNARELAARDVLVVGVGNSGAEIAVDIIESGARTVWLSVRTTPNILHRDVAGFPIQILGIAMSRLPVGVVDRLSRVTQRVTVGDLSAYGMPRPQHGVYTRARHYGRVPVLDVGLIRAIKGRAVEIVSPIARIDQSDVVLSDGRRLTPDVVIAATGFRRGLEPLVGHLGVLDARGNPIVHGPTTHASAPNLFFIGFSNPLGGNLRQLGIDARRIARAITASSVGRVESRPSRS
jgi:putative flavoprotein involved in K+ transport